MAENKKEEKSEYPDFYELLEIINSIKHQTLSLVDMMALTKKGMSVRLKDLLISQNGIYAILKEGVIKKVALYIDEKSKKLEDVYNKPVYHIYHCDEIKNLLYLKSKTAKGPSHYRIARNKDNKFYFENNISYDLKSKEKKQNNIRDISICPACLAMYNEQNQKQEIIERFSLVDFWAIEDTKIRKSFVYDYDHISSPFDQKSWSTLVKIAKQSVNYKCQQCNVDLQRPALQKFLHGHHVVKNILGKRLDMVRPICLYCHSNQEGHEDLKKIPDYAEYIEIFQTPDYNEHMEKYGDYMKMFLENIREQES